VAAGVDVPTSDRDAVAVADQEVEAIADAEALPLMDTVAVPERVGRAEFVGRVDLLAVVVAPLETDGWADGVVESDGCGVQLADSDGDPVLDAAGLRVPVRVAVTVRVPGGDLVMWRVRVALALAPSGGGIEARADFDALTDPDDVRLMLGEGSAVVVVIGESDAAGLTD
jgi:hypothetical protein